MIDASVAFFWPDGMLRHTFTGGDELPGIALYESYRLWPTADDRHIMYFAASQDDLRSLQRDLSAVAESYGVTDWERLDATYVAIGRGLASAEAAETRVRELAVAMADEDFRKLELIRWGYEGSATR